jgi:hypothetical protein
VTGIRQTVDGERQCRRPLCGGRACAVSNPTEKDVEIRVRAGKSKFQPRLATGVFSDVCVEKEVLSLALSQLGFGSEQGIDSIESYWFYCNASTVFGQKCLVCTTDLSHVTVSLEDFRMGSLDRAMILLIAFALSSAFVLRHSKLARRDHLTTVAVAAQLRRLAAKLAPGNQKLFLTTTLFHPEHAGGDAGFPSGTILIRNAVQHREMELHGREMIDLFASRSAQN